MECLYLYGTCSTIRTNLDLKSIHLLFLYLFIIKFNFFYYLLLWIFCIIWHMYSVV